MPGEEPGQTDRLLSRCGMAGVPTLQKDRQSASICARSAAIWGISANFGGLAHRWVGPSKTSEWVSAPRD
jgi:hypothetical protein